MSIKILHLRKMLQLLYLPDSQLISKLRAGIRSDLAKEEGGADGGQDFHTSFWADAKAHVAGQSNLIETTAARIQSNDSRKRLYPILRDRFLEWWNQKRRWSNQRFELFARPPKTRLYLRKADVTIKIENTLAARMGDGSNRIVYPYFAEEPALSEEAIRLGLWVMTEAFAQHDSADMRILDVLRATSYSLVDIPLVGDEEDLLHLHWRRVMKKWQELIDEYR